MSISFTERLVLPEDVLISNVQGESVLLNLNSERYFGLDEVGTRMLSVLTTSNSIQTAYEALLDEYDVENEALRHDLADLVDQLVDQGLLEVAREEGTKGGSRVTGRVLAFASGFFASATDGDCCPYNRCRSLATSAGP